MDIRPLHARVQNPIPISGSIIRLPFADNSVDSLSCLHVAEHLGLGRYGDPLDPNGTQKGIKELIRILAKGGRLYFSIPLGLPRVCFNAHRIHSPQQILDYFGNLELVDFSGVNKGSYHKNISPCKFSDAGYACGYFEFLKPLQTY